MWTRLMQTTHYMMHLRIKYLTREWEDECTMLDKGQQIPTCNFRLQRREEMRKIYYIIAYVRHRPSPILQITFVDRRLYPVWDDPFADSCFIAFLKLLLDVQHRKTLRVSLHIFHAYHNIKYFSTQANSFYDVR